MKHIEGNYYEHEGELYKKLKGTPRGYHIITEEGKQGWLRLKCTGSTPAAATPSTDCTECTNSTPKVDCTDSTPEPDDSTESTPVQIVQDEVTKPNCTRSTDVQGVQCTESTECGNTTSITPEPEEEDIDAIATELRNKLLRGGLYEIRSWRYSIGAAVHR